VQEQQATIQTQQSKIQEHEIALQRLDAEHALLEQLARKVASLEAEKTEKH
jgi:hypothetical protein